MTRWKPAHPRKYRGARITETLEEAKERWQEEGAKRSEFVRRAITVRPELAAETIETRYLMPEVEHFVETEQVKKIKDKVKLWLNAGYPVHIIGPTGCGKTTLATKVAEELGKPTVWMNGDETMTTADLVGGYSQVERESVRDRYVHTVMKTKDIMKAGWVDNPLTLAARNGYIFVYNDFSRAKPEANNVLLSVFQEGVLELPTRFGEERYIKVHPEFKTIFTSNSVDYAGVHRPQDALLDRTVGIYMDFYNPDTEVEITKAHSGVADEDVRGIVEIIRKIRKKLPDAEKPGTRACIMVAQGLKVLGDGEKRLEELVLDILATKVKGPVDLAEKQQLVKEAIAS